MAHCIFCPQELTCDTKPEHVLLNAFGGRMELTDVICSACNNTFGGTIDKAFAAQMDVFRNLLQTKSGKGKLPPGLRNIQASDQAINFTNDGRTELAGKPFMVHKREDGTFSVEMRVKDASELAKYIPHIAAILQCPEAEVIKLIQSGKVTQVSQRPDTVHHSLAFGGPEAIRSMTKSCLVLWATSTGNDEVRGSAFEEARRYVTEGGEDFVRARTRLDHRRLPCEADLTKDYGPFFNLIYVKSDAEGKVIGHFTLCNIASWRVVLAEAGGTANRSVGLVSNPLKPGQWSRTIAESVDIDFAWLREGSVDFPTAQGRLNELVAFGMDAGRSKELERMIEEAMARSGVKDGDPITAAAIEYLSNRVSLWALGVPHKQELTAEELQELVRQCIGSINEQNPEGQSGADSQSASY